MRRRGVLRALEIALLAAGFALLALYAGARIHRSAASAQALQDFDVARTAAHYATPALGRSDRVAAHPFASLPDVGEPDQSLWNEARIDAYRTSLETDVGAPVGVLTIPRFSLRAPIFEGTDDATLNRGIGRIEGTAPIDAAGNLGLAGHRDGYFRPLKDIRAGDAIEVESLAGTVRYRVTDVLIVDPHDIHVLDPTDGATLTLVTCYPFYFVGSAPQRYIVKAEAQAGERNF